MSTPKSEFNILPEQFPPEIVSFIRKHYLEIFGENAAQVYLASLIDNESALSFVARDGFRVLGGYRMLKRDYSAQILDFVVLPAAREKGLGRKLIDHAKERASLSAAKPSLKIELEKPTIFLDTRIYPEDNEFVLFLRKMGFLSWEPYIPMLGEAEWIAYNEYKKAGKQPKSFRRRIWHGSILSHSVERELDELTARQAKIVLSGLDKKLSHFAKSSKLSYKYEVCPICRDIGSTVNNPKCGECYLELGCKAPFFRGFRHDPQVGAIYFTQMRSYLERRCK